MNGDTLDLILSVIRTYAIAIVCMVLLERWLRIPYWTLVVTALVAIFLPGIPIFVVLGVIAWRLLKRQPLHQS